MPWFLWKGIDSRSAGIWVSELPPPIRAAERYSEVEILGRPGNMLIKQGENVHRGYVKECKITVPANADFASILTWLTGTDEVVFSNEPDRVYFASIPGEVKFTRVGNVLKSATIPFYVHPHKGQYPPERPITVQGTQMTLYNPGTVDSKPLIQITHTGNLTITIGEMTQTFSDIDGTILVDCEADIVTDNQGVIWFGATAPFLQIPVGESAVTLSDSATVTITPRWRWF